MFDENLVMVSKLISLALFFPIYMGALVYAFWGPNRALMDANARIPFED